MSDHADDYAALVDASEHARDNDRRDMFAAHALIGLLTADGFIPHEARMYAPLSHAPEGAAKEAFDLAEAMLRESERRARLAREPSK